MTQSKLTDLKPDLSPRYIILVDGQQAACFAYEHSAVSPGKWTIKLIKGEALTRLKPGKGRQLSTLLQEISEQLNRADALASAQINLIYDKESAPLLSDVPDSLHNLHCRAWQVLQLDPLLERAGKKHPLPENWSLEQSQKPQSKSAIWLHDSLLPTLETLLFPPTENKATQAKSPEEAHEAAHGATLEETHEQLAALREKNRTLEHRMAQQGTGNAHTMPDAEHLLSFLPALYQQAFTVLSGADLALLIGRIEPFDIPSPYQEPSGDALDMKQRTFLALPSEQQRQIVAFAQQASQKLRPRPNMQAHIRQLQENA